HRRLVGAGVHIRAGRLRGAADPRPARSVDAARAHNRPGHPEVKPAARCRPGDGAAGGQHPGGPADPGAGRPRAERPVTRGAPAAGVRAMRPMRRLAWLRRAFMLLVPLYLLAPIVVILGVSL